MIVKTKIKLKDFIKECDKYGWNEGSLYPANFETLFFEIASKYKLNKEVLYGVHNNYRYIDAGVKSIPDEDVVLEWEVIGELIK